MKSLPVLIPILSVLLAACGDRADAGARAEGERSLLDRAAQLAKDLPGMATMPSTFADLKTKLASITDGASARQAQAELQRLAAVLQQHVDAAGGAPNWTENLGAAGDRLVRAAREQLDKLRKDPQVEQAIGPVLAQLDRVLGS
jgi:hypothetical protein